MFAVLLATLTRHLRFAALAVAFGLVGAGGATAAMVSVTEVSVTEASLPAATVVVAPVEAPVYDQATCDAAANHGAYVSFVAGETKGMADRGALVSAAAQSDCGKKDKAEKLAAKVAKKAAKAAEKLARDEAKAAKVKPAKASKASNRSHTGGQRPEKSKS